MADTSGSELCEVLGAAAAEVTRQEARVDVKAGQLAALAGTLSTLAVGAATAVGALAPRMPGALVWPLALLVGAAVANLVGEVHERRMSSGWGPVTDRVSVSTWCWPEMRHLAPSAAVLLCGVIAPARHWRTGLSSVAPFAGLCPTALLLPAHIARNGECLAHAEYHGTAVVAAAGPHDVDPQAVDVMYGGRPGPAVTSYQAVTSRWVHELVYDRLLALHGVGHAGRGPAMTGLGKCVKAGQRNRWPR